MEGGEMMIGFKCLCGQTVWVDIYKPNTVCCRCGRDCFELFEKALDEYLQLSMNGGEQ